MAKKISKSDISDPDVFGALRESAVNALGKIQELDGVLRQMASDTAEKLKNVKFDSAKSINEFTKAAKEANNVQKESIKIDQEEAKLKQQIVKIDQEIEKAKQQEQKTQQQELRTQSQINREKERQAKIAARNKKMADDEANAYKKLVKETRNLKNESKTLAAEMINLERAGKRNTKEYAQLENRYKSVTKAAQKADNQLKKIDSTVGDNFRNVGNYSQAVGKLKGMLGQLGLAFGGLQIMKSAGETMMNFEQTMANLSSITGATGADLKALEDAAISLGGKTTLSASQVAEGFKLIGSAKPELLEDQEALIGVTEEAIKLAEAAGITLPEAASALTNTLNQFGADADEAAKFVDVLAAGSKFGAGDINFLNAAMEKAGTVAKVAGLDFRETGAALEVLAKSGVPAEKAGTDFRNILLKLQAAGIGFVDGQFEIRAALDETKDMLGEIEDPAERAAEATKLFGSQSVASAEFMMQNIDLYDELNEKMDENGIAAEQQKTNTETLQGAIAILKSKWEEFLLTLNQNVGIVNILKGAILFLANNLSKIMKVVGMLVKGFIAYKTIQMAVIARQKLLNLQVALSGKGFRGLIGSLGGAIKGMLGFKKGMKGAATGAKGLGNSLKAIPFIAIIGAVLELASAMWDLFSNTEAAAEAQAKLDAMMAARAAGDEKREKDLANNREGRAKALEEQFKTIEQARRQAVIDGKSQAAADAEAMEAKKKAIQANIDAIRDEHKAVAANYQAAKKTNDLFKSDAFGPAHLAVKYWGTASSMKKAQAAILAGQNDMKETFTSAGDALTRSKKVMDDGTAATARMNEELHQYQAQLKDVSLDEQEANKAGQRSHAAKVREIRTGFSTMIDLQKELNSELREYVDLQKELEDIVRDAELDIIKDQMKAELDFIKASSELGRKVSTEEYERLAAEKLRIQQEQLEADRKEDIASEQQKFDDRFAVLQKRLDDEKARLIENAKGNQSKIDEINANAQIEQEKLDQIKIAAAVNLEKAITNITLEASIKKGQLEIKSAKDTAEKVAKIREKAIEDQFDRELQEEELALLKAGGTKEEIQKALDAKEIELLKKKIEEKKALGLDTLADEIALMKMQNKQEEDEMNDLIEKEKAAAERRIQIASLVTDAFIEQSNKRIAALDEEIAKAEETADFLRAKAAEGNIDAQESLAEQQRIIDEANQAKEQEQRRQERIKMAFAAYEAYERNASDPNVSNPLAKTITDITLLKQFISSLPTFYDGVEDTGMHGEGVDGKGGFHAILHPNERVIPKAQNDVIGNLSNQELASLANQYHAGKLIHSGESALQIGGPWQSAEVIAKLDQLNNTIKNKAEHDIRVEEIIDGTMTIVRQSKEKNSIIFNRYRVNNKA